MWQRFTEEARRVILLAQEEAGRARSLNVDTEHLLLGLFVLDEERTTRLFTGMGVQPLAVRAEAVSAVERATKKSADEEPKLTPNARRVLEFSSDEARRASHTSIDVEHLLLGLIRQTPCVASDILLAQGADLEKTRVVVSQKAISEQNPARPVRAESGADVSEIAYVIAKAFHWAKLSHREIGTEQLLLSLLERREDLLVEISGLDVLALKKARLQLLVRLDLFEQATALRDEIESEQS